MKVLIVDDNDDNRMTLSLLLESFDNLEMLEARDGLEAVEICKKEKIDLLFMDIMMPKMNGITATKRIKKFDKKVMIVAVTALDDEVSKEQMVLNGAEDYIVKPIDSYVFNRRVKNYLELIKNRHKKSYDTNGINLFTAKIYNRYTIYRVIDRVTLAEAWEYYLSERQNRAPHLVECIRIVYAISAFLIDKGKSVNIVSEENEEYLFITLLGIEYVDETILKNILFKHYPDGQFILKDKKLSFKLQKSHYSKQELESENAEEEHKILRKTHLEKIDAERFLEETPLNVISKAEELEDLCEDMDATLFQYEKSGDLSLIMIIADILKHFATVMDEMLEFQHLAHSIFSMEQFLKHIDGIDMSEENKKLLLKLLGGLMEDLTLWQKTIFVTKEAVDVHYLDSSLLSSVLQIESALTDTNVREEGDIEFF